MKKTLIALSLAATLVAGNVMAQTQLTTFQGSGDAVVAAAAAALREALPAAAYVASFNATDLALSTKKSATGFATVLGLSGDAVVPQKNSDDFHVKLRGLLSKKVNTQGVTFASAVSALEKANVTAVVWASGNEKQDKKAADNFVTANQLNASIIKPHEGGGFCISLIDLAPSSGIRPELAR